jgi:formylglycine-generating enzyme required for sulfatase activity
MKKLLFGLLVLLTASTHAAPPVVSNIRAGQRAGTHLVDIYYNVSAIGPCTVYVAVSDNGGTSYNVPVFTLTGAVGPGVTPGNDRLIVWNAGTDWPGRFNSSCKVRITADDGTAPPAPLNMAYIPGGSFQMGDTFYEIGNDTLPLHNVYISPFFMDKYEVARELWLDVYTWATGNGYTFNNGGSFAGPNRPLQNIYWFDAVKWCNARSEKAGLTPVYYTDATQTTVYRTNTLNLTNACVKWTANGYRLPTEAEWEKAARGNLSGKRYPWGDTISGSQANYAGSGDPQDGTSQPTTPVGYYNGSQTPAGVDMANGYGLYDMAGNVSEWCWDWYDGNWYGQPGAGSNDSHGPANAMSYRLVRGGGYNDGTTGLRCAQRASGFLPGGAWVFIGFRCVRGL